jgi:mxaK protein
MELMARHGRGLAVLAAALYTVAICALVQLSRIRAWNTLMASPAVMSAPSSAPPEVRLAQARALAARGDFWAALTLYRQVAAGANGALRQAATYDEGNLLLREGVALNAAGDEARAQPLLQLAKESYRQVLREHPGDWDAKYNLELALRWAPESDDEESLGSPPPINVKRSNIVRRAMPLGLP